MKLKKGDEVKVIKGKDKGKMGRIDKVLAKDNTVVIPGINEYKRHKKARSAREKSEIVTIVKGVRIENVLLVCPQCHKPTRIGFMQQGEKKQRICKKCEQVV